MPLPIWRSSWTMGHGNSAMAFPILLLFFWVSFIKCYDKDSFEFNPFEPDDISPLYDTIIFNDIVDILNDMEPRGYLPPENIIKSESESEENMDDLLTEYQHFMENKAHRQLVNHIKKSKSKIKSQAPIIRSDNYMNAKPVISLGRDRLYEYFPLPSRVIPPRKFLDMLLSQTIPKSYRLPEETDVFRGDILLEDILKAPSPLQQISETALLLDKITNQSNCSCRGQPQCECECTFCKLPLSPRYPASTKKPLVQEEKKPSQLMLQLLGGGAEVADRNHDENTISIKINLDIQLPRQQDKLPNKLNNQNFTNSKMLQPIGKTIDHQMNLPFPLFPIPIDIYSLNKMKSSRMRSPPSRIHSKKRKATIKSNNKKHKRKLLTFHNINLDAQPPIQPIFQEIHEKMSEIRMLPGTPEKNFTNIISAEDVHQNVTESVSEPSTTVPTVSNNSQSNEALPITGENTTDDIKFENNIEATESQTKTHDDAKPREKRDVRSVVNKLTKPIYTTPKRMEKSYLSDSELLYWPYNPSSSRFRITANNITNIIKTWNKDDVWTDDKPESMFTRVNWTDINMAVKTFLFIAGKYAKGALTFCSDTMCHSVKCAEATCTYRTCAPAERWKQKGHCTVAPKRNDNVAQLQSMKDVRTDLIFQLVDTMQEKLIGRLVGKVTLCIGEACKTFLSMKKLFGKGKCPMNDLTSTGHCSTLKILKLDA